MLKRLLLLSTAALIVACVATQSFGGITIDTQGVENRAFFLDVGVVLRDTGAAPADSYGGLVGWERVDIGDGGTPLDPTDDILPVKGDIEFEIFQAQNIHAPLGTELWIQGLTDRFQGYAAFEVSNSPAYDAAGVVQVEFKPISVADPFGVLAAGEVLALYEDTTAWDPNAATLAAAITSATDGSLWATFGFDGTQGADGGVSDGYLYQRNDNALLGNPEVGTGFAALNVVQQPGIPGLIFTGVNDASETLFGDVPPLIMDLWAQQKFSRNAAFDSGLSLFQFESDDPMVFAGVPEPTSLIVFGMLFAGLFVLLRLRRRNEV